MHPLAVGPAPHILAGRDDRTAPLADHSGRVRLVVAPQGAVLILVSHRVFLPRAAQIFKHALLDFAASEIWRRCHVCLLRMRWRNPASVHQCGTAASQKGGQWIASTMRGAMPRSVLTTPQWMKP